MQLSHGRFANRWLFDYKLPLAAKSQIIVPSAGALFSIGRPGSTWFAEKTRPLTGSLLTLSSPTTGLDPYQSLVSLGVRSHSIFRLLEQSTGNNIPHSAFFLLPFGSHRLFQSGQCIDSNTRFCLNPPPPPKCKLDRLSDLFLALKIPQTSFFFFFLSLEPRLGSASSFIPDTIPATPKLRVSFFLFFFF